MTKVFEKFDSRIQSSLAKFGLVQSTMIQDLSVDRILAGKNCLLVSETGTGKTLAALLPVFHMWLKRKPKPISILYITPMKSLNRDMLDHLIHWGKELEMDVTVRHGDTSQHERKMQQEFPNDMMIVTLETLQPILYGRKIREHLRNVKYVILDECLPYDAEVTLSDGSTTKIGELVEANLPSGSLEAELKDRIYVKSFDADHRLVNSKVVKVHKIPVHTDGIYIRTRNYNLELEATSNHPILVVRNKKIQWVDAGNLKHGDKVIVHNHLDGKTASKHGYVDRDVLTEEVLKDTYIRLFGVDGKYKKSQKTKLDKIVNRLKEKHILPLKYSNDNIQILARLAGHILGDGWLTITKNTKSIGFSSSPIDLASIKYDLLQLGFATGDISTRNTNSVVKTIDGTEHEIHGTTNQVSNGSKILAAILVSLGVPYGEKSDSNYVIPEWIMEAPKEVKRNFLAAYLGSEMSIPKCRKYLDMDTPKISVNKRSDLAESGIRFASQLEKLLGEFDVKISDISVKDANIRKDGRQTKKIIVTISNEEDNLINLFGRIGIEYAEFKEAKIKQLAEYLLAKRFARLNKLKLVQKIRELKKEGLSDSGIGKILGIDQKYGKRQTDVVRSLSRSTVKLLKGFPSFKKWCKTIVGDCLLDDIDVIIKKKISDKFVYDITVDETHNFLANNIVVHNCHEVADSKRGVQLTLALERLKELCSDFQLVMLSATVGDPEHVANFFAGGRPVEVVTAKTEKSMDIRVISPKSVPRDSVIAKKVFTSADTAARIRTIMDYINKSRSTLVFTNTREFAEILSSRIKTIDSAFPLEVHHSSLSKDVRIQAERNFKQEKIKALIATSSLQLGIDIGSVEQVLQYMSPREVTQLTQRVGRSGHAMGRVSNGVIITSDEDDIFESAVIARKALAGELEKPNFHEGALDVMAHQILGLTLDFGRIDLQKAYSIITRAYPYKGTQYAEFLEVCKQMERLGLVFMDDTIGKRRRGFEYYFSQLSTIPSVKRYHVFNTLSNTFVGVLDEEFVALHGDTGTTFIFKGEPWSIISVEEDRVMVEPASDIEAAIPGWEGELIPVPYSVAQEVGRLRGVIAGKLGEQADKNIVSDIQRMYPVDEPSAKKMLSLMKAQAVVPDDKTILVEDFENLVILHACFGTNVNETLGRLLASLLTTRVGSVGLKTDPYRIMLQFQNKNTELVREILFHTNPSHFRAYLEMSLGNSELFEWKFVHVAKRFGAISSNAEYGKVRMKKVIEDYAGTPIYKETMKELEAEKLDIPIAIEVLKKIQSREIAVVFKPGLSPIGRIGVRHKYAEVVGPKKPEAEIFELFKQRLLDTEVRLVCANCGEWDIVVTIRNMKEKVKCRKCESMLLAVLKPQWDEAKRIMKKGIYGKKLDAAEKRRFEHAMQRADLFIVYGRNAAIALAGRGIGPTTARRILAKPYKDLDGLLKAMLDAERQFIKNRKFWAI